MQCRPMINEAAIQEIERLRLLHMSPIPRTHITERFPLVQATSTEHMPAAEDQGVDVIEITYSILITSFFSLVRVAPCPSKSVL